MKLSRKAKKRLIVLGVMLSPVFLLLVIYLAHFNEPSGYTALRQEAFTEIEMPLAQPSVTPDILVHQEIHSTRSIPPYMILRKTLWQIPRLDGYCMISNQRKQTLIEYIEDRHVFSNLQSYSEFCELTDEEIDDIHSYCDEIEELLLVNQDKTVPEINKQLFDHDLWYSEPLKMAIFRASLSNDKNLAFTLFDIYLKLISDAQSIAFSDNEMVQFLWSCYDMGLLDESRIDELKQNLIKKYHLTKNWEEPPPRYAERNSELFKNCEAYCEIIKEGKYTTNNSATDIFLRENLSGLPFEMWHGFLKPIRIQRAKKLAVAMTTNDLEQVITAEYKLFQASRGIHPRSFSSVNSTRYGIYFPKVREAFPWFHLNTNYQLDEHFEKLAFLVILENKIITDVYPQGKIVVSNIEEPITGYHQAYMLQKKISIECHDEFTTETTPLTFSSRPIFISAIGQRCLESYDGSIYSISSINESCGTYVNFLDKIKDGPPLAINYRWTASNWLEAEPILRDVLVNQRPEEDGGE
jgi:hypothetical protein